MEITLHITLEAADLQKVPKARFIFWRPSPLLGI
jgi:hypothetical protein